MNVLRLLPAVMVHPVHRLLRRQRVPTDLRRTFEFFERPANLPLITPPWLGFRIITPEPIVMRAGLILDYRVKVLGIPTHWRSLIREYDPPSGFRDVQVIGPYRRWDHRHRFWREQGETVIEDDVVYEMPLGPLGSLANHLLVRRQLEAIFAYRRERIAELVRAPDGVRP